ncbi:cytochrome P450 [Catenaria anguillulae PL171]|uniref:Cytochrome P450 n=1 Tax=Catenaria anguillulae PL171 TaxID=765915 RepID=A0A1Y2HCP3_9FUNG|nr:cytochrome P450 [Catenaria anguillulae PL171]
MILATIRPGAASALLSALLSRLPSLSQASAASALALALLVLRQLASNLGRRRALIAQSLPFLPHTSPLHLLRGHLNLLAAPEGAIEASVKLVRELGSVFVTTGILGRPTLWIADPVALKVLMVTRAKRARVERSLEGRKLVAQIVGWGSLLTLEGAEHRSHRKILDPAFNLKNLTPLVPVVSHITDRLISILAAHAGEPIDFVPLSLGVTLNVIGQSATETDFDALNQSAPSDLFSACKAVFSTADQTPLAHMRRFVPLIRHLPLRGNWEYAASLARVRSAVDAVVNKYALSATPTMAPTAKVHMAAGPENVSSSGSTRPKRVVSLIATLQTILRSHTISNQDMSDELMGVLLAGHETTAISFSMAVHELGRHPDVLRALYDELKMHDPDELFSGETGYTKLAELPLLNAVINETLRMHSPIGFAGRQLVGDDGMELPLEDGRVVRIEKGQRMMIPYNAFGLLPSVWGPTANQWQPSRWFLLATAGNQSHLDLSMDPSLSRKKAVPSLFVPFGAGSHMCIGRKMALLELRVLIARMVLAFEWESMQEKVKKRSLVTAGPVQVLIRLKGRDGRS